MAPSTEFITLERISPSLFRFRMLEWAAGISVALSEAQSVFDALAGDDVVAGKFVPAGCHYLDVYVTTDGAGSGAGEAPVGFKVACLHGPREFVRAAFNEAYTTLFLASGNHHHASAHGAEVPEPELEPASAPRPMPSPRVRGAGPHLARAIISILGLFSLVLILFLGLHSPSGQNGAVPFWTGPDSAYSAPNYYSALNITPHHDQAAIRRAFRKTALARHPDKNRGASSEEMVAANEAWSVMRDPLLRCEHDVALGLYPPMTCAALRFNRWLRSELDEKDGRDGGGDDENKNDKGGDSSSPHDGNDKHEDTAAEYGQTTRWYPASALAVGYTFYQRVMESIKRGPIGRIVGRLLDSISRGFVARGAYRPLRMYWREGHLE